MYKLLLRNNLKYERKLNRLLESGPISTNSAHRAWRCVGNVLVP